jgi:hypothetical protein
VSRSTQLSPFSVLCLGTELFIPIPAAGVPRIKQLTQSDQFKLFLVVALLPDSVDRALMENARVRINSLKYPIISFGYRSDLVGGHARDSRIAGEVRDIESESMCNTVDLHYGNDTRVVNLNSAD